MGFCLDCVPRGWILSAEKRGGGAWRTGSRCIVSVLLGEMSFGMIRGQVSWVSVMEGRWGFVLCLLGVLLVLGYRFKGRGEMCYVRYPFGVLLFLGSRSKEGKGGRSVFFAVCVLSHWVKLDGLKPRPHGIWRGC